MLEVSLGLIERHEHKNQRKKASNHEGSGDLTAERIECGPETEL